MRIESTVESLVSRYEKHFDSSSQQPTEQHSLDEMIIAENRPLLHHADEMPEKAMNLYWRVESCWTKSLNYHFCKTLHVRHDIF